MQSAQARHFQKERSSRRVVSTDASQPGIDKSSDPRPHQTCVKSIRVAGKSAPEKLAVAKLDTVREGRPVVAPCRPCTTPPISLIMVGRVFGFYDMVMFG